MNWGRADAQASGGRGTKSLTCPVASRLTWQEPALALGAIVGAIIGTSLIGGVSPAMLKVLLGGLLVLSALKMFGLLAVMTPSRGKK